MNRKKIKYFGLILMLLAFVIAMPSVFAVGGNSSEENNQEDGHKGNFWIQWVGGGKDYRHFVKITAYAYNKQKQLIKLSNSQIYCNNDDEMRKLLSSRDPYYYNNNMGSDKISYIYYKNRPNIVNGHANIKKLNFKNIGAGEFRDWFLSELKNPESGVIKKINNDIGLDAKKLGNLEGYYYVVEPVVYFTGAGHGIYFFGTPIDVSWHFYGTSNSLKDKSYVKGYQGYKFGSVPTIRGATAVALTVTTEYDYDPYNFIGDIVTPLKPYEIKKYKNYPSSLKTDKLTSKEGWALGIFWRENDQYACNKSFNSHFPIDENGKVQMVVLNSIDKDDATLATAEDIANDKAVNCCDQLLQSEEFGNDKDKLCNERPECCSDCDPGKKRNEENATSCLSNLNGSYQDAGNDKNTWYCMKAFDQYSQYLKTNISYNNINYARVVCRETLTTSFPDQLLQHQSVGSYMVWPTSTENNLNNYPLIFSGAMTCMLSIDKAEIDASGNANNIYKHIYNTVKNYEKNGTALNWYNLNSKANIKITYNDDEYGGTELNLVKDEETSSTSISDNGSSNWYEKLNSLVININKEITYKLPKESYNKLTTSGIGSNNLNNMFDEINKNQFVYPKFGYGILPISYTAKVTRNISAGATDYYKLTIKYSGIGDNSQFATQEKDYTCPYEVTFAPPTNIKDDPNYIKDVSPEHDDNNEMLSQEVGCYCNKGTKYFKMNLDGYLIKNPKMTCDDAQRIYCDADRGNMNVEYRVISLTEPFPGSGENATTMAQGGRDIGYNWRDVFNQTKAGSVVSTFILNNRRVKGYEVYNLEPLYVIELDSAKIKAIRDYNKTTTYADFNLICRNEKDGTICTSKFLNQYVSSGTCQNADTLDKFYKCADKDVPASEK